MFALLLLICAISLPNISAQCPNIVSRREWGARSTALTNLKVIPVGHVIIHHSTGPTCTDTSVCKARVKSIQDQHIDINHWSDIGYNFLVAEDGNVYEGRGWGKTGAHAPGYNSKSIGICVIGDYSNSVPNAAALNAIKLLISCGQRSNQIKSDYKLLGHRQVRSTECPGDTFYEEITTWNNWASKP